MADITIVNGVYKPTYNWGAPSCSNLHLSDDEKLACREGVRWRIVLPVSSSESPGDFFCEKATEAVSLRKFVTGPAFPWRHLTAAVGRWPLYRSTSRGRVGSLGIPCLSYPGCHFRRFKALWPSLWVGKLETPYGHPYG